MPLFRRAISGLAAAALLASCGGGGNGGGGSGTASSGGSVTGSGTSQGGGAALCSLIDRQRWAEGELRDWYLFPETLPASLNPAGFSSVGDYVDALTATARAQRRDRFFTFVTSIAEENAFFSQGASAGFGIRLSIDGAARRVLVSEAFEGAPALAAGIDRGSEIVAIGTSSGTLRTVSDIIATEGDGGVINALGPSTPGTTRILRISDAAGVRDLTIAKAEFDLSPLSSRYGSIVIDDNGRRVGYLNMRTFISTADAQLRNAFAAFRAQGITDFVIDLRYNGGGLVSTAELMGDLLGGNRLGSDVFSLTTFRASRSSNDETRRFQPTAQSVSPVRIAFIATGATASASEVVINSLIPYYGTNLALIGANSFGKPVGQIARDRAACDDRLRVVAFSTQNASNGGFYYDGLADVVRTTCQAPDDLTRGFGDPAEASLRQALDFLAGRSCTAIAAAGRQAQSLRDGVLRARMLSPEQPSVAQREVPGLF